MPVPLSLHVELGPMHGTSFESGRLKHITIGRTRVNRFQIKDETISQKHMSIDWGEEGWMAQDLGSSNGTTVNGVNIGVKTPYRVYTDDLLRIGVDTRIRVVLHDGSAPRVTAEPPVPPPLLLPVKIEPPPAAIELSDVAGTCERKAETASTLRDWFRQELVRIPTILHERAEATIREMEIHTEQMKRNLETQGAGKNEGISEAARCR